MRVRPLPGPHGVRDVQQRGDVRVRRLRHAADLRPAEREEADSSRLFRSGIIYDFKLNGKTVVNILINGQSSQH